MLSLFKLINVIDKQMSPLEIQEGMCSRIISSVSGCSRCTEYCPSESIRITEKEIQVTDCLQCGICTTVCPTGALSWKRPSPKQILSFIERLRSTEEHLYIYCSHSSFPTKKAMGLHVPCLATIPWEIWIAMLQSFSSVFVYLPNDSCQKCPVTSGEQVWKQQVKRAEEACQRKITICKDLVDSDMKASYDPSRRQFFYSVFREMKQTNKEVLKEYFSAPKTSSVPDSRSDADEENVVQEITKEFRSTKDAFIEKITDESYCSYADKRKIMLSQLKQHKELQQRVTVKLPVIQTGCDICGACTVLCPTQALQKIENDNEISIQLYAAKCVDCGLCEHVCWEKHISMQEHNGSTLLQHEPVNLCRISSW